MYKTKHNSTRQALFKDMKLQVKDDVDGEYVVLGLEYDLTLNSDSEKFIELLKSEYIHQVKQTEQKITLNATFGASVESVINEEISEIKQKKKGVSISAEINVV